MDSAGGSDEHGGVKSSSISEKEKKVFEYPLMASGSNINSNDHHHHHHHHHMITSTNEIALQQQQHHHHHHHQMDHMISPFHQHLQTSTFPMMQSSPSSSSAPLPGTFNISKDGTAYDLGELDQALFLYLDGQDHHSPQEQRQGSGVRPHTLNIFPSQPMHVEPSSSSAAAAPKRSSQPSMASSNPRNDVASAPETTKVVKREGNRKGPTSTSEQGSKTPDPKAYVQQLETCRMRLTQLEQEIQRARSQGFHLGGSALLAGEQGLQAAMGNVNSDAANLFDMEYARWLEEHHRLMAELRHAMEDHLSENELRVLVDSCLALYDQVMNLKNMIAKSDVFHLLSGMWQTPAERCFMWIGGFRPSELIKTKHRMNVCKCRNGNSDPNRAINRATVVGVCGLQQSTREAEEALSQGLDALNQSLTHTITSDSLIIPPNMNTYMAQMALAINKLSTLEGFLHQADNLRQQTLHRMDQILTTRQAARCFLAIGEYFHRLRALSSLWVARPRQE
ncbi:UNVERIFIED_CONTAM: bZIP transcription factor TGA10 [Sesamum radiatum]|uniref:BZIP transcription factor TGA10 n=1 Tax=Sesamum radiatum TaxID=300843 RepID=A0AAW2NSB5_SESRA